MDITNPKRANMASTCNPRIKLALYLLFPVLFCFFDPQDRNSTGIMTKGFLRMSLDGPFIKHLIATYNSCFCNQILLILFYGFTHTLLKVIYKICFLSKNNVYFLLVKSSKHL